jgi:hypothetical protein
MSYADFVLQYLVPLTLLYRDMLWVGSTIRKRFRIISGNQCYDTAQLPKGNLYTGSPNSLASAASRHNSPLGQSLLTSTEAAEIKAAGFAASAQSSTLVSSAPPQIPRERSSTKTNKTSGGTSTTTTKSGASITLSSSPEHGVSDWTAIKPRGTLTEHMVFARNVDWAATPLGPMTSWSDQFREIANLVMQNPHPCSYVTLRHKVHRGFEARRHLPETSRTKMLVDKPY